MVVIPDGVTGSAGPFRYVSLMFLLFVRRLQERPKPQLLIRVWCAGAGPVLGETLLGPEA